MSVLLALALAAAPAACQGPRAGWARPSAGIPHLAVVNRVAVAGSGLIRWNGVPIDRDTLGQYLALVRTMRPLPFTILQPAPNVDCAFLRAVRDDIAAALPCAAGACGEWAAAWTEPLPPPTAPMRRRSAGDSRH